MLKEKSPDLKRVPNRYHEERLLVQKIYGGFCGVCIIAITQMIAITSLDVLLIISLFCFAIAIPFLLLRIMIAHIDEGYKYVPFSQKKSEDEGLILTIIGLIFILWHFSIFIAVSFVITIIIVMRRFDYYGDIVAEMNKEQIDEDTDKYIKELEEAEIIPASLAEIIKSNRKQ